MSDNCVLKQENITELENNGYLVQMPPTLLRVGKRFHISPSYVYAAIKPGIISITSLITKSDYELNKDSSDLIYGLIEDFIGEEEETVYGKGGYSPLLWVIYEYVNREDKYVFPACLFLSHVTEL